MTETEKYINSPLPIQNELLRIFNENDQLNIFDIGACEGLDSIRYAQLFPNASVFAFEPLAANVEKMNKLLKDFQVRNIKIFQLALSNRKGEATFHVSSGKPKDRIQDDWDYGNKSSSLLEPDKEGKEYHSWLEFKHKVQVVTDTLDSFCNNMQLKHIDIIHMDVQGAELMVLQGAKNYLPKIKLIWTEVERVSLYKDQPLKNEIEKFMKKNNFKKVIDTVGDVSGDQLYVHKEYKNYFKREINHRFKSDLKNTVKKLLGR